MSLTIDLHRLSIEHIKLLNEISPSIVSQFNEIQEAIYSSSNKNLDWLVSSPLSRHTHLSDLYINICYLELIIHLVYDNPEIEKIIVPSAALKKVLDYYFFSMGKKVQFDVEQSLWIKIKNYIRPYWNLFVSLEYSIITWWLGSSKRAKCVPRDREIIFIDTFLLEGCFSKDGAFQDRYYPGLMENLPEEIRRNVWFVPHFLISKNFRKYFKNAENSTINFLNKHDFLKLNDYFYALLTPFRLRKRYYKNISYKNINIGPLLKAEHRVNKWNFSSFIGLLNYRLFKRLKESGIRIKLTIDWFENQVIDKGFNKGIKDYYPGTYTKGYQGFIISYDYNFYLQPTPFEIKVGIVPNEICVIGQGLVAKAKKLNSDLRVTIAPAFRFKHLWEEPDFLIARDIKNILIALPIAMQESYEIMSLICVLLLNNDCPNYNFFIKPHPCLSMDKLKNRLGKVWPEKLQVITDSFNASLAKASVLIGSTSSTCAEALAKGIPVIIVGSQTALTQNPIPDDIPNTIWRLCYKADEVLDAIHHFMNLTDQSRRELRNIGAYVRDKYFERLTKEGVKSFIRSNG